MNDVFVNTWNKICDFFATSGWKIILVICMLVLAFCLIRLIVFVLKKILFKTKVDPAVTTFIGTLLTLLLWIGIIILIASLLDISLSSLIVALSSLALAVGLALKDSLANLANGVLIIINKPFRRGDYIEVGNVTGKIYNIKLLTTEIMSTDNKKIVVPNSFIVNNPIVNSTSAPTRRIDKLYTVHYKSDMKLVESVLFKIVTADERILKYPEPTVFISNHGESAIEFTVRFWVNTPLYWDVVNSLDRVVFDKFKESGIEIPYNQLDIHMIKESDSDSEPKSKNRSADKNEKV